MERRKKQKIFLNIYDSEGWATVMFTHAVISIHYHWSLTESQFCPNTRIQCDSLIRKFNEIWLFNHVSGELNGTQQSPQELSHKSLAFLSLVLNLTSGVCEGLDAGDKLFWVNLHEMEQWDYEVHAQISSNPPWNGLPLFLSAFHLFVFYYQCRLRCWLLWWSIDTLVFGNFVLV